MSCKQNDSVSQRIVYDQYSEKLRGFVYNRIKNQAVIDPILNEAFTRAFKNIDQYAFQGSFQGWLQVIVRHAISDYILKNGKEYKHILFVDDLNDTDFGIDRVVRSQVTVNDGESNVHMQDHLRIIENTLNQRELTIFMLFYEGYSHREIGEMLKIHEGTSKWWMNSARNKLKKTITKESLLNSK